MSTHSLNIQGPRRQSRPPRRPGGGAPQAGFSLMEVLVAIGLLALGFVAVAAIFPTGAVMQRETAHDVHTRNLLTNIEATIKGTNLRHEHPDEPHLSLVDNYTHGINVVMGRPFELRTMTDHSPLSAEMAGAVGFWSVGTRTSPASRAPAAAENLDDHLALVQQRPFVWVPLLRNRGGEDENGEFDRQRWRLVVFVLRRHHPASEAAYPFLGPTRLDFLDYPDYPLNHHGDALPKVIRVPLDDNNPVLRINDSGDPADGDRRIFRLDGDAARLIELGHIEVNDQIVDSLGQVYRVVPPLNPNGSEIRVNATIGRANPIKQAYYNNPRDRDPHAIWIAPRATNPDDSDDPAKAIDRISPVHAILTFDLPAK